MFVKCMIKVSKIELDGTEGCLMSFRSSGDMTKLSSGLVPYRLFYRIGIACRKWYLRFFMSGQG